MVRGRQQPAARLLPTTLRLFEFLNADEIARGLSPFNPSTSAITAGRIMIEAIDKLVDAGESFAFETTCAGQRQARLLQRCRDAGYRVIFLYLWLPSPQAAIERVAQRVSRGGHNIPAEVIVRRYAAGVYSDNVPLLIAEKTQRDSITIRDATRWKLIEDAT